MQRWMPLSLRGYQRSWLVTDIVAGVTLSAVAIPEVMGYTSIAQTPVVSGLYTVIFPTVIFALLGASRLLVVGADSATAAILAAGLGAASISGVAPNSDGYVDAAIEIQALYLDGKKDEAAAAVPAEWLEKTSLVGPASYVQERVAAYKEAGVTVLAVNPIGPDAVKTIEILRGIVDDA